MPLTIRLTILKPSLALTFAASRAEGVWFNHSHPPRDGCLPACLCACWLEPDPTLPRPKSDTQMDRVCSQSREAWPRVWSTGALPPPHAKNASLVVERGLQHLGYIRVLEMLLVRLPAALLAHLNTLKLTQIWKSALVEHLPFPWRWLDSDTLGIKGLFVSFYETL